MPIAGAAKNTRDVISPEDFMERVRQNGTYTVVPERELNRRQLGDVFFGEISWALPAQARFSFDLAVERILEYSLIDEPFADDVTPDEVLAFDEGRSLIPLTNPVDVIATDYGFLVRDGHNDFMASWSVGASTIPMRLVGVARGKKWPELREWLWSHGFSYPIDVDGQVRYPRLWSTLVNDPNRFLASLLTLRVKLDEDGDIKHIKARHKRRTPYPVIVKVMPGVPFQELQIADILREAHFVYDAASFGADVPDELIKRTREILGAAKKRGDWRVEHVVVVGRSTYVDSLPLERLVNQWLDQRHVVQTPEIADICAGLFR